MRLLSIAIACTAALLSACAQPSTHSSASSGSTKKAGAMSCDGFIKPGSALQADLDAYVEKPVCERKFHPGGEGYAEFYQLGGFSRSDGKDGQTWALFGRAYGDLGDTPFGMDENTFDNDRNFRRLADVTPTGLPGNRGAARVSTFDMGGSGFACVDALTDNPDGSHTVVGLCRSIATTASDAERLALAQSIAANDLPGVTP